MVVSRIMGQICLVTLIIVIDSIGLQGLVSFNWFPWLIIKYKYKEYAVVNRFEIINRKIKLLVIRSLDIIAVISLITFSLGGMAIFIEMFNIHAMEFIGTRFVIPLIMIMFRVFIFSYRMFVIKNKHDEVKP